MINAITIKEIVALPIAKLIPNDRNRGINPALKSKLQTSMTTFGFRPEMPIWVDKDLNIVDGHNRYAAAMQLGIAKVPVIVVPADLAFHQIIQLTGVRRAWSAKDWCSYYKKDNSAYTLLEVYAEEFSVSIKKVSGIIGINTTSGKNIPKGTFAKAPDSLFTKKINMYRGLILNADVPNDVARDPAFIGAFAIIAPVVDEKRFVNKVYEAAKRGAITPQIGVKGYLDLLNRVYNSGAKMEQQVDLVKSVKKSKAKGANK